MIDSEGGAFGFDCYLASPEFRVFQQPARGKISSKRQAAASAHLRYTRGGSDSPSAARLLGGLRREGYDLGLAALQRRTQVVMPGRQRVADLVGVR